MDHDQARQQAGHSHRAGVSSSLLYCEDLSYDLGALKGIFQLHIFRKMAPIKIFAGSFDVSEFNRVYSTSLKVQIKTYHPNDSCNVYSSFVNVVNVVSVVNVVNAVNVVLYT